VLGSKGRLMERNAHNLAHALKPRDTYCRHEAKDIDRCVICDAKLDLLRPRVGVDTCSRGCHQRLMREQERLPYP
jgi:hypothetical protein